MHINQRGFVCSWFPREPESVLPRSHRAAWIGGSRLVLLVVLVVGLLACENESRREPESGSNMGRIPPATLTVPPPAPAGTAPPPPVFTPTLAPMTTEPAPKSTPAPQPTATSTPPPPSPTLTPAEVAAYDLSTYAPWVADPQGPNHEPAAQLLTDVWLLDTGLARDMARIPWVSDGIRSKELNALMQARDVALADREVFDGLTVYWSEQSISGELIQFLHVVTPVDAELAKRVIGLPWVSDGLEPPEDDLFILLLEESPLNVEAAKGLFGLVWVADEITTEEVDAALNLFNTWSYLPELGRFATQQPWVQDGLTDLERSSLSHLVWMSETGTGAAALAVRLAGSEWYPDWVDYEDSHLAEHRAFKALESIGGSNAELSGAVVKLEWLFDDLTPSEASVAESIAGIAESDLELALWAANAPWVTDGVSRIESSAVNHLMSLSRQNLEAARLAASFTPEVPARARDAFLIRSLYRLHRWDEGRFRQLISEPWFRDGLDPQERAYVTALKASVSAWYDDLYESYFTRSATINLPLSGEVSLWVFQHKPFPDDDDTLIAMEQAVQGAEEFMRLPFPVNDVIIMSVKEPEGERRDGIRGFAGIYERTHVKVSSTEGFPIRSSTVYHELAHYFFSDDIGPEWLSQGGADLVEEYVFDLTGHSEMEAKFPEFEDVANSQCREHGLNNINELLYTEQEDASRRLHCVYHLGRHFLLSLYYTMGHHALTSALGELYLSSERSSDRNTEEEVYLTILKHTPAELQDEVRALYRNLHGGPFIDSGN